MGPEEEKGGGEREGKEEKLPEEQRKWRHLLNMVPTLLQVQSVSQLASEVLATFCQVLQMDPPRLAQGHTSINS